MAEFASIDINRIPGNERHEKTWALVRSICEVVGARKRPPSADARKAIQKGLSDADRRDVEDRQAKRNR
jgi:hypothetical protein